jgi:hypothetical protein
MWSCPGVSSRIGSTARIRRVRVKYSLTFFSEGTGTTRLELEHRHIERHGDGWEKLRLGVDAPGGWTMVLGEFPFIGI